MQRHNTVVRIILIHQLAHTTPRPASPYSACCCRASSYYSFRRMEARYKRGVAVFRALFIALVTAQVIIWVLYGRGVTRGDFLSVAEGSLYALAFSAAAVCIWVYGQRASSVVLGVPLFGLNSRTLLSRTIMLQAVCCAGAFVVRAVASLAVAVAAALDVDDHLKEVSGEGIGISLVVFVCLDIAPAALILLQNRRALGRSRVPGPAKVLRPCVTALCRPCCWLRGRLSDSRGSGSGGSGGQGGSLGRRQPLINADAPLIGSGSGDPSLLSTGYGSRDSSSSQLVGSGAAGGLGSGKGSASSLTTPLVSDSDATAGAGPDYSVLIGSSSISGGAAAMPELAAASVSAAASLQHARAASAAGAVDLEGALRSGRGSVLSVASNSGSGVQPLFAPSHSSSAGDLESIAAAAAASGVSAAGVLPVFSSGADAATMLMAAGGSAAAFTRAAIAHAARTAPGSGVASGSSGEGAAEPLLAHGEGGDVDSGGLFGGGYAGFDSDMGAATGQRRKGSDSSSAAGGGRRPSAGSAR